MKEIKIRVNYIAETKMITSLDLPSGWECDGSQFIGRKQYDYYKGSEENLVFIFQILYEYYRDKKGFCLYLHNC